MRAARHERTERRKAPGEAAVQTSFYPSPTFPCTKPKDGQTKMRDRCRMHSRIEFGMHDDVSGWDCIGDREIPSRNWRSAQGPMGFQWL